MFNENFSFQQPSSAARVPRSDLSRQSMSPSSRLSSNSRPSRSVSPCSDPSSTALPSSFTVTDLAAQFATQRIQKAAQMCYDSCESYANTVDDDADWAIPPAAPAQQQSASTSQTSSSSSGSRNQSRLRISTTDTASSSMSPFSSIALSRRSQRQSSTRLLCASAAHQRDLAALVSRMIEGEDQCCLSSSPTRTTSRRSSAGADASTPPSEAFLAEVCCASPVALSSSPVDSVLAIPSPCPSSPSAEEDDRVEDALMLDEDEGYDSGSAASNSSSSVGLAIGARKAYPRLEYRRASDFAALHSTSACVSKKLRLRCRHHRRAGTGGS